MPEISVVMGVHNCKNQAMISQSVYSIINQTFSDWEMVICADGSSEETLKYLYELQSIDSRIKVVSYEENHGLAYALNYALQYVSGRYIARQDDEDISYPNRLQLQFDFLEKHMEYAMVGSCADVCDDTGDWGKYSVEEVPRKYSFLWNCPFLHPSLLFRREALNYVNGYRVAKETRRCEDYDLFMRMYAKGLRGYNLQETLYKYRMEITKDKKYRTMKDRVEEAQVRFKGFKQLGILVRGFPFVIKPIVLGLIPQRIFYYIRRSRY